MAGCLKKFGSTLSPKDGGFISLTAHRLKVFEVDTRVKIVSPTIALLNFKHFKIRQAVLQKIVKEIHQGRQKLVAIGPNPFSKNSPIKGYLGDSIE